MKQMRLVTGLFGAALAAGLVWAVASGDSPKERVEERAQAAPGPAKRELDDLRAELRAIDRAQSQLAREVAKRPEEARVKAPEPEAPVERVPELSDAEAASAVVQRQLDVLELALATEVSDPEWSPKAEAELRSTVADLNLPGIVLEEASCSGALCKVTLGLGEGSQPLELHGPIFKAVRWHAPRFIHIDGDETHKAFAYFAREGHPLPMP